MSFLDDLLNPKQSKEANLIPQGENKEDHFDRKVKSSSWLESVSELDPAKVEKEYQDNLAAEAKLLGKEAVADSYQEFVSILNNQYGINPVDVGIDSLADMPMDETPQGLADRLAEKYSLTRIAKKAAYEQGDSVEETLKKDYARDVSILSDYALAEIVAGIRGHVEQNTPEMFNEHKEKAKKDVASNRKKVEDEVLKATGTSAQVDWKKEFERYSKEAKPEEVKEKDLYKDVPEDKAHNFNSPSEEKFKVPKNQEKALPGNGREADERKDVTVQAGVLQADIVEGLGKVASIEKKADYEGWSNQDTWAVALWLDNDQALNAASAELAQTVTDPVQLQNSLREFVIESQPELGASLWDDLLNHSMANVNWKEIADHFSSKFAESSKKDIQTKEAHCGSCPGDPSHEQVSSPLKREELYTEVKHKPEFTSVDVTNDPNAPGKILGGAEMCPVCGGPGRDLKNSQKDNMSCKACGISYASAEPQIQSHASKEDVLKLIKTAEVASPWQVIKDAEGNEVIARVEQPTDEKVSEEKKDEEIQK